MHGSVTAIVQPDGDPVKQYTYDEFGSLSATGESSFDNEITYTGSITDTSTGLQYMNARFYEPSTGRFISQDSYSGNAYDPWTQHLYSYCGNNPTNFVDPTGHFRVGNYYDTRSSSNVPVMTGPIGGPASGDEQNNDPVEIVPGIMNYDEDEDVYYYDDSTPWIVGGYGDPYNFLAPGMLCFIDSVIFEFNYDDSPWRIEAWMGTYGWEHVKIIDNLLRWKGRQNARKLEAEDGKIQKAV